jgi:RNA polymerase sigma-70 factor (ECF subfamily)
MTDEKIMHEVQNGNIQKLAILFERYHVKIYNYFFRLTRQQDISEDLTQEVFHRILKYRDTYKKSAQFTSWMYRIGRNLFIDHTRKNRDETSIEDLENLDSDSELSPEDREVESQEQHLLQQALSQLSPQKREILVLSRFQGMKYKEISIILSCSIASVKTQVYRATKQLRNIYIKIKQNGGSYEADRL